MRFGIKFLLYALFVCAFLQCVIAADAQTNTGAGIVFQVQNAMQQVQVGRNVDIQYGSAPSVEGTNGVVLRDLIQLTTDSNGMVYITNAVPGYYAFIVQAPPSLTPLSVYLTNALTNWVNATNYLVAPTNLTYTPASIAWSIAASDGRYLQVQSNILTTNSSNFFVVNSNLLNQSVNAASGSSDFNPTNFDTNVPGQITITNVPATIVSGTLANNTTGNAATSSGPVGTLPTGVVTDLASFSGTSWYLGVVSPPTLDTTSGIISAPGGIVANITGNLTGNVTGNLIGTATGNLTNLQGNVTLPNLSARDAAPLTSQYIGIGAHPTANTWQLGFNTYVGANQNYWASGITPTNIFADSPTNSIVQAVAYDTNTGNLWIMSWTDGVVEIRNPDPWLTNGGTNNWSLVQSNVVPYPSGAGQTFPTSCKVVGTNLARLVSCETTPSPQPYSQGYALLQMLNTNGITIVRTVTLTNPIWNGLVSSNFVANALAWVPPSVQFQLATPAGSGSSTVTVSNVVLVGTQTLVGAALLTNAETMPFWDNILVYQYSDTTNTWKWLGWLNADHYRIANTQGLSYNPDDGCIYQVGYDDLNDTSPTMAFARTLPSIYRVSLTGRTTMVDPNGPDQEIDRIPSIGHYTFAGANFASLIKVYDLSGSNEVIAFDPLTDQLTLGDGIGSVVFGSSDSQDTVFSPVANSFGNPTTFNGTAAFNGTVGMNSNSTLSINGYVNGSNATIISNGFGGQVGWGYNNLITGGQGSHRNATWFGQGNINNGYSNDVFFGSSNSATAPNQVWIGDAGLSTAVFWAGVAQSDITGTTNASGYPPLFSASAVQNNAASLTNLQGAQIVGSLPGNLTNNTTGNAATATLASNVVSGIITTNQSFVTANGAGITNLQHALFSLGMNGSSSVTYGSNAPTYFGPYGGANNATETSIMWPVPYAMVLTNLMVSFYDAAVLGNTGTNLTVFVRTNGVNTGLTAMIAGPTVSNTFYYATDTTHSVAVTNGTLISFSVEADASVSTGILKIGLGGFCNQ